MKSEIDKSRWHPDRDIDGNPIGPGDLVSIEVPLIGSVCGILAISEINHRETDNGKIGALVVVDHAGVKLGPIDAERTRLKLIRSWKLDDCH
jgi:hypothetical protein